MLEYLPYLYAGAAGAGVASLGAFAYHKAKTGMRAQKLRFAISVLKSLQNPPDDTADEERNAMVARLATLTANAKAEAAKLT